MKGTWPVNNPDLTIFNHFHEEVPDKRKNGC